jgi:hypothetical protein
MKSNIGVQLFPVVLLVGSFGYYMLQAFWQCGFCFVLSVVFWFVLFSDDYTDKE